MKHNLILIYLIIFFFGCAPTALKQSTTEEYKENIGHNMLPDVDTVQQSERKTAQMAEYVSPANDITEEMNVLIDSIAKDALKKKVQQYTVQVYVGNDSKEANEVKMDVFKILPNEKPRVEWSQPNFRVKVGRFTNRLEAYKTLTILKKSFPGALLVPERVYINQ